ncbi:2,5-diamino-6-ribosylamino-4(3H)-pyrimidinone 5'-phosphate reductase [Rhodotorula toruloides]|nr:2,5-diamino-6-ribosylamino-4(3H)-pyrimidinone 5'-phosphate reductase [Rhodotorula toruloides]
MLLEPANAGADPALALVRDIYPADLLVPVSHARPRQPGEKPFVTLTYAQSLDGKIAGKGGKQLLLSGQESMTLTHRLRQLHDSILVGVGTVINDDPQLTARIPHLLPLKDQPLPIVLDSSLRMPLTSKLLSNARKGISKAPLVVCKRLRGGEKGLESQAISEAGGKVYIANDFGRGIDLRKLIHDPAATPFLGRSLMVEGGASVISSFLATPGLVDLVIVTVAPVLVGDEGVSVTKEGVDLPRLEHVRTQVFGKDAVFVCKPVYP